MAHKLFVGGLNFATSNERLRELFAECGQVDSATVVTDRDTGRSRGFGFVEMGSNEEAEQAISKFNGQEIDGRRLQVEKAKEGGGAAVAARVGAAASAAAAAAAGTAAAAGGSRRW